MNLKNVEVMENTKKTSENRWGLFKTRAKQTAVLAGSYAVIASSHAAEAASIDTTGVVEGIKALGIPIAAIGGAYLLMLVILKGWKIIRRAM